MYGQRYGRPLTDEERAERHAQRYPGEELPPRGTGLQRRGVPNASLPMPRRFRPRMLTVPNRFDIGNLHRRLFGG